MKKLSLMSKRLMLKGPPTATPRSQDDPRRTGAPIAGGRRAGEGLNPYLTGRRSWNDHVGAIASQRATLLVVAILCLLIALASIGGVIYLAQLPRFKQYYVEVDRLGQTRAVGAGYEANKPPQHAVHAAVSDWVQCARMVSPDISVQRKCVFRVYSMLSPNDPATSKMNEFLNGTPESTPFSRAEKEMVNTEIRSVIPQTETTWQVEWVEATRDRQGVLRSNPVTWRALMTVYVAEISGDSPEDQLRMNPLSLYVRDFSWSRVQ